MTENIAVDKLQPNPWNRKTFDPTALQELTDSIKASGIKESLIVRQKGDIYEIASGNRRWLAAQAVGLKEVPCIVQSLNNEEVQDMNLIANIQREDMPPLELARMIDTRIRTSGLSHEKMAQSLGKSRQWVEEYLGFLNLPEDVRTNATAVALGVNPLRHLKSLAPEHQQQVTKELKEGTLKPHQVTKRANQLKFTPKTPTATSSDASPVAAVPAATPSPVGRGTPPGQGEATPTVHTLATALKDDAADAFLPQFGRVGGLMRSTLDKAWKSPKEHLFKWGLVFMVVSWLWHPVMQTLNYALRRVMHVEVNQAINQNTVPSPSALVNAVADAPQKFTAAMLAKVAPPAGLKPELLGGGKIHFTWNPVPGCAGYNFYSAMTWEAEFHLETKKPLTTPEGYWKPDNGLTDYKFVVTAVDAQGNESVYSEVVDVDLRQ